jgi:hypothetical protein
MKVSKCTMSNKENEKFDGKLSSTEKLGEVVPEESASRYQPVALSRDPTRRGSA